MGWHAFKIKQWKIRYCWKWDITLKIICKSFFFSFFQLVIFGQSFGHLIWFHKEKEVCGKNCLIFLTFWHSFFFFLSWWDNTDILGLCKFWMDYFKIQAHAKRPGHFFYYPLFQWYGQSKSIMESFIENIILMVILME